MVVVFPILVLMVMVVVFPILVLMVMVVVFPILVLVVMVVVFPVLVLMVMVVVFPILVLMVMVVVMVVVVVTLELVEEGRVSDACCHACLPQPSSGERNRDGRNCKQGSNPCDHLSAAHKAFAASGGDEQLLLGKLWNASCHACTIRSRARNLRVKEIDTRSS